MTTRSVEDEDSPLAFFIGIRNALILNAVFVALVWLGVCVIEMIR